MLQHPPPFAIDSIMHKAIDRSPFLTLGIAPTKLHKHQGSHCCWSARSSSLRLHCKPTSCSSELWDQADKLISHLVGHLFQHYLFQISSSTSHEIQWDLAWRYSDANKLCWCFTMMSWDFHQTKQCLVWVPKSMLIKDSLEFFLVFVSFMSPSTHCCNTQWDRTWQSLSSSLSSPSLSNTFPSSSTFGLASPPLSSFYSPLILFIFFCLKSPDDFVRQLQLTVIMFLTKQLHVGTRWWRLVFVVVHTAVLWWPPQPSPVKPHGYCTDM